MPKGEAAFLTLRADGEYIKNRGDLMDGQDLSPELLLGFGDIIGNVTARGLPFNVQNLLGNWLMLIGQAIITFNAQQQYMENGPGNFYDLRCKNIGNNASGHEENTSSRADEIAALESRIAFLEQKLTEIGQTLPLLPQDEY